MRSHTRDADGMPSVFSRDCPEYYVRVSEETELVLLPNHFASKGSDRSGKRRRAQSRAVRDIYRRLRTTHPNIVVTGDLNDFPAGGSLKPLLTGNGLKDAMALSEYEGQFPGTYKHANASQKIDYLLLSPALVPRVQRVDVFRRGFYAPTKWEAFENLTAETKERFQASDHHCLWADIEVD
jgi:predicted extracellular nuclease